MEQGKSNMGTVVLAIIITAVVVGGGVYLWQQNQIPVVPTPPVTVDTNVTPKQSGTTFDGKVYKITYPVGWNHEINYGGDMFYKESSDKYPSLVITEPPTATDQGMCLKQKSEKTLTTKNGLTFVLTFNVNDKEGEICKDAFDKDFVQVFIGNDLSKWMYYTYLPTDTQAEKDLKTLLESIKLN